MVVADIVRERSLPTFTSRHAPINWPYIKARIVIDREKRREKERVKRYGKHRVTRRTSDSTREWSQTRNRRTRRMRTGSIIIQSRFVFNSLLYLPNFSTTLRFLHDASRRLEMTRYIESFNRIVLFVSSEFPFVEAFLVSSSSSCCKSPSYRLFVFFVLFYFKRK